MPDHDAFSILGFTGSLRRQSINLGLLRAAQSADPGIVVDIFDIGSLPLFNQDFEHPQPTPVAEFKQRIADSDALLIATPEYNQSMPGTLKNALDWAARPNKNHVLSGKPVGIMGASSGKSGTMRAQLFLRGVLHAVGCRVLHRPEVFLAFALERFDQDGYVTDPGVVTDVHALTRALKDWSLLFRDHELAMARPRPVTDASGAGNSAQGTVRIRDAEIPAGNGPP